MFKKKKATPVKTQAQKEPEAKSCSSKESNLDRLVNSGILADFVKTNNGSWDHQKWLVLCECIKTKGFTPVDFDQVGLALEREKATLMAKKNGPVSF